MKVLFGAGLLLIWGCAATEIHVKDKVRFRNRPIVWRVNDKRHTPQPEERLVLNMYYPYVSYVGHRVPRLLALPDPVRAQNINALDEVLDSTWYTNRLSRFDLSPEQIARGPNEANIDTTKPWLVTGTKIGGASVGFLIRDGRGDKYLLKFDVKGLPEMETAADVVAQRLLWAAGYNVPEDSIVVFSREQLALADDAEVKDRFGNTKPLKLEVFEEILANIDRRSDGKFRGLASKFLSGQPLGGYSQEGTRPDDPNDLVPHEHRRELRGQYVFFSWLNHTDLKEGNWLDMWVPDRVDPERRYIRHYLIDFGKALGVMAITDRVLHEGHLYSIDIANLFVSTPTLGLWRRPWERMRVPELPGIGAFESETFEPSSWKPRIPFAPFDRRDPFDDFWAAKVLMRFTPAHLHAAVQAGRYSNPESENYIVRVLAERQEKIGRWAFARVNPLDEFEARRVDGQLRLCSTDLWVRYNLSSPEEQTELATSPTRYRARALDYEGTPLGYEVEGKRLENGRVCVSVPTPENVSYVVVSLRTSRAMHPEIGSTDVHVALEAREWRVVGVRRF